MSIDAMKQALEALEWNLPVIEDYGDHEQLGRQHRAITALRAAIEQAQDPVAVWELQEDGWNTICDGDWLERLPVGTKLYAAPRQWQGLTEDEREQFRRWAHPDMIEAIELRLQERNT